MLISAQYREQNEKLHEKPEYGKSKATSLYWPAILQAAQVMECKSILDYGCGKGVFKLVHDGDIREYDPAIADKSADPEPADLLICLDVMEHIEPDCLEEVLTHMASKATKAAFISVATRPAIKTLPDGRNAHLIQEHAGWWITAIAKHFKPLQFAGDSKGFWILCAADKS